MMAQSSSSFPINTFKRKSRGHIGTVDSTEDACHVVVTKLFLYQCMREGRMMEEGFTGID